jgi:hypothetical protein
VAYIDLCTVAEVNNYLAQSAGVDASVIGSLITNFSQYILTRTGRSYLGGFRNYAETYNGNGSFMLQLRNYPILAVSSIVVDVTSVPQSTGPSQSGWVIDTSGSQAAVSLRGVSGAVASGGSLSQWSYQPWNGYGNAPPLGQSPYLFREGIQNVAVSYTAGQVTNQWYESATVPSVSPYTVTVANSSTFWQDEGVTTASGAAVTGYAVANGVYTFPASAAGEAVLISYQYGAVPQDLNEAAVELVSQQYKRRKTLDQASQVQPGIGTTNFRSWELSPTQEGIIDRYRRRFLD